MSADDPAKQAAAERAAALVEDGMVVGLGTGSTAALFVRALGARVRAGLRVVGVPTSEATDRLARAEGVPLTTLEERPRLDLTADGADAVDPALDLIKGLGGALLREKIVAAASRRFVVMVGEDKLYASLARGPVVPVEVVRFGWSRTRAALEALGAEATLRARKDEASEPFVTDGGNVVLDCRFADLADPPAVAARVKALVGVVEHGLFIGMATDVLVGDARGGVRALARRSTQA